MMAGLTVFSILIIAVKVTGREYDDTRDAEIDELLKKLNKPALKSIKSPDGDIIDYETKFLPKRMEQRSFKEPKPQYGDATLDNQRKVSKK
ncbi:hypothetical protein F2Q68_00035485 [Brassica cretica]|uniref:Uncharacterized protein n=1 Tax=Brassica cretica TaxID=69181 RepID=A0A8S9H459_BRACR|nr:hypothetical protein F2Q68_00035485 [Brassica cretica]